MRIGLLLLFSTALGCWAFPTFDDGAPTDAGIDASHRDSSSFATDTGSVADTRVIDTSVVDTGDDPPPYTCQSPLPSSFACTAIPHAKGMRVCTDAMIAEFANCFGTGDAAACAAAQKKYPECNSCVLMEWIVFTSDGGGTIDSASCVQLRDPGGDCGRITRCNTDCLSAVCSDCDPTAGSGRTGSRSELEDCYADARFAGSSAKPKGVCYDVASKVAAGCATFESLAPCFVHTIDDVITFYRGACRDGGDWSATEPAPDAGADADAAD